jgi:hypothetical protein
MTLSGTALSRTGVRLGAYLVALSLAFGVAYAGGAWLGPTPEREPRAAVESHGGPEPAVHDDGEVADREHGAVATILPGLQVSQDGYTLSPAATVHPAGVAAPFRFTITGADATPLTAYEPTHERDLHLIVVRRDLSLFQHLHPVRNAAGEWSVPLQLPAAGTYRVFADFAPADAGGSEDGDAHAEPTSITLGTDIAVAGAYVPAALPTPVARATVDGYDVTLSGTPAAGRETELTFTVQRDGVPISGLQPYLGAFGHLVSLRAGDLAYLHTHPAQEAKAGTTGGPDVRFATTFPTPGSYRLFLDFRVAGSVRTAAFTVTVPSEATQGS